MAIEIPVPDSSYPQIDVTLGGISYDIVFRENSREQDDNGLGRLYFDIYKDDSLIKAGIKVMENQPLIAYYLLEDFSHGDILCLSRDGGNKESVTRNTLGFNKYYGLFYISNEELRETYNVV